MINWAIIGRESAEAQASQEASAYKGWNISSFRIEGLSGDIASRLGKGLAIPKSFKRFKRQNPVFYPQTLTEDINRARLYMARNGYPFASVRSVFEPHPTRQQFALTLVVTPGRPVRIESVSFEGLPDPPDQELGSKLNLSPGAVFSDDKINQAGSDIQLRLRQSGFARAQVENQVERIDSTRVKVVFRALPGGRYYFGNTAVQGAGPDLVPLVRKTMAIRPGTPFSPQAIDRAQDNIRLLDLFRKIRLNTVETAADTLDLAADLTPRKPKTIEFGIGYWTDGQLRVRALWLHRNLFKSGRGLSIGSSASRHLQMARLSFWWPALVGARTRESMSAKIEGQREDSYHLLSTGGELSSSYRHSLATTTRISIEVSNVDVTVKTDQTDAFIETGGLLSVLALRWTRNAANDRLYPTRGSVTWIRTEWAPNGSLSDSHYASMETSGALYLPLWANSVLASRLSLGLSEPTGESVDLLPNKRFFAGGASSMRGFERRKLGPKDGDGAPLGGEAKVEASLELRAPLVWRFRWALFLDSGQVWRSIEAIRSDTIELAAGPGLMVRTPVGPFRMDLGRRLTSYETNQPKWVFHLSIGHPF